MQRLFGNRRRFFNPQQNGFAIARFQFARQRCAQKNIARLRRTAGILIEFPETVVHAIHIHARSSLPTLLLREKTFEREERNAAGIHCQLVAEHTRGYHRVIRAANPRKKKVE